MMARKSVAAATPVSFGEARTVLGVMYWDLTKWQDESNRWEQDPAMHDARTRWRQAVSDAEQCSVDLESKAAKAQRAITADERREVDGLAVRAKAIKEVLDTVTRETAARMVSEAKGTKVKPGWLETSIDRLNHTLECLEAVDELLAQLSMARTSTVRFAELTAGSYAAVLVDLWRKLYFTIQFASGHDDAHCKLKPLVAVDVLETLPLAMGLTTSLTAGVDLLALWEEMKKEFAGVAPDKHNVDLSIYRPASEARAGLETPLSDRAFRRFLKDHDIRTHKPSPQRLLVHIGDWTNAVQSENEKAFRAAGAAPDVFNTVIQQRTAAVPKRASRKQRSLPRK
jgi:hypothetical protein